MVLTPYVLTILGSSLSTGRLAGSDQSWVPTLLERLRDAPEAKGPITIYNMGKGSQTSAWGVTQTPLISALRPTHVLMEGFAINDCVDFGGGPAISRAQHIINIQTMVADLRANNPGVIITIQTMNPVSAVGAAIRPQLLDYYNDEIATATTLGCNVLDNYGGTVTVPGGWPKPLPGDKTNGGGPFVIAPTGGYVGQTSAALWNNADKSATMTLNDGDHTAYAATAAAAGVRGNEAVTAQKHFEHFLLAKSGTAPVIGIGTAAVSLTSPLGSVAGGAGMLADGSVQVNGATVGAAGFVPAALGIYAVEVNRATNLIYFMNGAIRSAGFDISGIAGAIYPMMTVAGIGVGAISRFTTEGDGLHPLWTGGIDTYLFPNVLALCRAQLAALWP